MNSSGRAPVRGEARPAMPEAQWRGVADVSPGADRTRRASKRCARRHFEQAPQAAGQVTLENEESHTEWLNGWRCPSWAGV